MSEADGVGTAPSTIVSSLILRAGMEERLDALYADACAAAEAHPGYRSLLLLDAKNGQCHVVAQFDSEASMKAWPESPGYRNAMAKIELAAIRQTLAINARCARVTLPSEATAPKWKAFLLTWGAILPIVLVLNAIVTTFLPQLPRLIQSVLTTASMSATVIWLVLPQINRFSRTWRLADERLERA